MNRDNNHQDMTNVEQSVHMSDVTRIATRLVDSGYISRDEAEGWGCKRLASRINDLRNKGWIIETVYGKSERKTRYAKGYKLKAAPLV